MDENSNITIVDLTKLISIIYQMVEKQGPSNVHDILEAIMNNLPKQESIKKSVSNEEILIKGKKEETGEEINSDLEKQGVEAEVSSVENDNVYLDKGKAAPEPSIYNPEDYSKVIEDESLTNQKKLVTETREYESNNDNTQITDSNLYYSDNANNELYDNSRENKGYTRSLNPPFTTAPYYNDEEPYPKEISPIGGEITTNKVDWSDAKRAIPGQIYSSLKQ